MIAQFAHPPKYQSQKSPSHSPPSSRNSFSRLSPPLYITHNLNVKSMNRTNTSSRYASDNLHVNVHDPCPPKNHLPPTNLDPYPPTNHYGLCTPRSKDKQNLIDQIINKCQSPRVLMNKCTTPKGLVSPTRHRIENKENSFGSRGGNVFPRPGEWAHQRKRSSDKRNDSTSNRESNESLGSQKTLHISRASHQAFPAESQEYFLKNAPHPKANPTQGCTGSGQHHCNPLIRRQPSNTPRKIKVSANPGFYSSCISESLSKKALSIRKKIAQEREEHLEHCRNEERKLRLYYVELENKLCEIRTKELQTLAEYQATKLKELDGCLRKAEKECTEEEWAECEVQLERIHKKFVVGVSDSIRPSVEGCLRTSATGVLFSFDQTSSNKLDSSQ